MNTNFNNNIDGALSLILVNGKTYQLGKDASSSVGGIAKLYQTSGQNVDGSMTQAAIGSAIGSASDAINAKIGTVTTGKTVVEMISDAQAAATYDDTALAARVTTNEGDIAVLKGGASTEGSVAYQIAQIVNDNQSGSIDTLNEIAAWIVNDQTGAAKMAADITALTSGKKDKQTAVTNIAGGADKTLATLTQNANGDIAYTMQTIQDASASQHGLMAAADYSKLAAISATVSGDTLSIVTAAVA